MWLRYRLLLIAQWAWAAYGFSAGFNYPLPDTTAIIHGMTVDAAGNTYLTGSTSSSTFQVTVGVFQPAFGGGQCIVSSGFIVAGVPCDDVFVVKLDPNG